MPHKKPFFSTTIICFFKIENCCGTLNWPLILSLYQITIKICYFQYYMLVLWKKQTKKSFVKTKNIFQTTAAVI